MIGAEGLYPRETIECGDHMQISIIFTTQYNCHFHLDNDVSNIERGTIIVLLNHSFDWSPAPVLKVIADKLFPDMVSSLPADNITTRVLQV